MGRAMSHRRGGNIHGDRRSCRVLRLEVSDLVVLQELSTGHPLNQHHNLWGTPTTAESCPGNTDDLLKDEVKHRKVLLLDIN
jgi:hypothetical protein